MLDLRPNKWLKNSRLPIIDDIMLFIFNDSEYNKGGMDWRLGKITAVRNPGICYQLCEGFQSKGTPHAHGPEECKRYLHPVFNWGPIGEY